MPVDNAEGATWSIYLPVIVAFGVVVLTTLGNTLLEWFRQGLANRHKATALRRALLEEIRLLRDSTDPSLSRTDNPIEGGHLLIPVPDRYQVYDSNIKEIGLLKPAEIAAVTKAYTHLNAQKETYSVLGSFKRSEAGVVHAIVDSRYAGVISSHNRQIRDILNEAFVALSR